MSEQEKDEQLEPRWEVYSEVLGDRGLYYNRKAARDWARYLNKIVVGEGHFYVRDTKTGRKHA